MGSPYGSEWRKWDLHVHTPFSILNNQFGLRPEVAQDFDEYVVKLFTAAVEKDICAIGITDYFSLEGYSKIRNEYLNNKDAMVRLFPDEKLRNKVLNIAVFPNIELRASNIIAVRGGKGCKDEFVDFHVIFSDKIDPAVIERKFLNALSFSTLNPGETLPLNKDNIIEFGEDICDRNGGKYGAYRTGLEGISLDFEKTVSVLSASKTFSGNYLIAISIDEALPKINWQGRGYPLRSSITQRANIFFSSSEATREWASGQRGWSEKEFGFPRPCIVASDAHDFAHLFEPDCKKYCWIKADLTFEGLLQVLCEPCDRVAIQKDSPDDIDSHKSIESLQFNDPRFQDEPVVFSNSLTCIIGGRSTGKSMLLRNLAWGIDYEYAREQEARCESNSFTPVSEIDVVWRDHVASGKRKIIYLPQTFLNRTVDDPESGDGSSRLIGEVLMQDAAVSSSFKTLESKRKRIQSETAHHLDEYFRTKQDCDELNRTIIEKGRSELFEDAVRKLERESNELAGKAGATKEELDKFKSLSDQKISIESKLSKLENDISAIRAATPPKLSDPRLDGEDFLISLSSLVSDALHKIMDLLNSVVSVRWGEEIHRLLADLTTQKNELDEQLMHIEKNLDALRPKVEQSVQLSKAMSQLSVERKRLAEAKEREAGFQECQNRLENLRNLILSSRVQYQEAYNSYCKSVEQLTGSFSSDLSFSAEPTWRLRDFERNVLSNLNSRKFGQFQRQYKHSLSEINPDDYNNEFLADIWRDLENTKEDGPILQLKTGASEEEFIRTLFDDWYNIHYIVTSDGDQLSEMSPGKKGLVLLELLIELERDNCPILIDQPEDDLDNRSIYEELRRFIRNSKKRRQIIVVTHNANIVLGADAEEIIVANQDGVEARNSCRRFEYRSGSIENNTSNASDGAAMTRLLDTYSIQDHICRTLEGGREALEQRRKKYGL